MAGGLWFSIFVCVIPLVLVVFSVAGLVLQKPFVADAGVSIIINKLRDTKSATMRKACSLNFSKKFLHFRLGLRDFLIQQDLGAPVRLRILWEIQPRIFKIRGFAERILKGISLDGTWFEENNMPAVSLKNFKQNAKAFLKNKTFI